jgi:precorrin-2/cobalt-factor-2 C20-methyltransferase
MQKTGILYGIGVGPGDPELLTLKAVRIIQSVPIIAYPATALGGESQARSIVAQWLTGQQEVAIRMPCQEDRGPANRAYDKAATALADALAEGEDVAVLCEGDPLFYGSFIYLYQRLAERFPCQIIPGISSVSAVAAVAGKPLASGQEQIVIVPASAGQDMLRQTLNEYNGVAIIKPGRHRRRIVTLLKETGRIGDAVYVEYATRAEQRIVKQVKDLGNEPGPYFALFLITPSNSYAASDSH